MVYVMRMQYEAQNVKSGYLEEMFDAGTWRVRNIWDGVKLEVTEDESPVVLHSFTHLDPDLPLFEVRWNKIAYLSGSKWSHLACPITLVCIKPLCGKSIVYLLIF